MHPLFLHDCHIIRVDGTTAAVAGIIAAGSNFSFDIVNVSGVGLMVVHLDGGQFFFCKGKER